MKNQNLLFVCGKNRLRSPTAEAVFSAYAGLAVDSAGIDRDAEVPVGRDAIEWADIIFVLDKTHQRKLREKFKSNSALHNKRVVCLDIPDNYKYMQAELIELLQQKVLPLLGNYDN
jgi:predicted protein tyrosine phosphatase